MGRGVRARRVGWRRTSALGDPQPDRSARRGAVPRADRDRRYRGREHHGAWARDRRLHGRGRPLVRAVPVRRRDRVDGRAAWSRPGARIAHAARRARGRLARRRHRRPAPDARPPFFIEWTGAPDVHPGSLAEGHPSAATDIAWVEIASDADRFADWTGDAVLPVRFVAGEARVVAVAVTTPAGELVIR